MGIHIRADCVIQPSQIHALESSPKQHLQLTLNDESLVFLIRFKDWIEPFRNMFVSPQMQGLLHPNL